jgi:hypothetical protein
MLWRYLTLAGIYQSSFEPNDVAGKAIYFNEGRRLVGLTILRDMEEAAPDILVGMMREFKKEK